MNVEGSFLENKFILTKVNNILETYGVSYFSYGRIENDKDLVFCFNHHDWGRKYMALKYFNEDPLVKASTIINNSIIFWEMVPINNRLQKLIMDERLSDCNLTSGITISTRNNNVFEILALGFSNSNVNSNTQKYPLYRSIVSEIFDSLKEDFHGK